MIRHSVRSIAWAIILTGASTSGAAPDEVPGQPLTPIAGADGAFEVVREGDVTAWRGTKLDGDRYAPFLYFESPDGAPTGGPVYVEVEFKDVGKGRLSLQYNAREPGDNYREAAVGYGRMLSDSGERRTAVFELTEPGFRHAQNLGADLRLGRSDGASPLHVFRLTLHARPTALFLRYHDRPWLRPYTGPSRNEIDATTLRGKVLCGYQGWFRCPGDGTESGWVHWSRNSTRLAPDTLTVDMWPDLTGFSDAETYPAPGFTYPDGRPAALFSSANPLTVDRHFDWMRTHGIDGVLVQRFVGGLRDPAEASRVLGHARAAANRTGRVFAVEYDMTGVLPGQLLDRLTGDWKWLVDEMKITADPRYLRHDGKPVLAIFGFYDDRFDSQLAHRIIDAFKTEDRYGVTLVGGCQWYWRSTKDPGWARAFRRLDVISPWNVGNVSGRGDRRLALTGYWARDLTEARRAGRLYLPVIYPGFSWNNLQRRATGTTSIPRLGGEFLWDQFSAARRLDIDMAFVAMFDEVDEGTAIFKVTNAPPVEAHFATFDGLPSDWYLRLTGEGSRLLRKERAASAAIPIRP